ncbi:MAG TPA: signal peptidase I [Elusimicrobiota bacterium]|jgi:signal peptidase I|nr:signal peptidase I [Elusimicrobiota bacterium]
MSLGRLLVLTLMGALGAALLRATALEGVYIASGSMEPTLPVGAHLFLDKVTPRLRDYRRGEIISFRAPIPPYHPMVKRVIAVAGDTVELRKKVVYLNGSAVDDPYARHSRPDETLDGDNLGPLQVPEGKLFVLGDNRDESDDSSVWRAPSGERVYFVSVSWVDGLVRGIY